MRFDNPVPAPAIASKAVADDAEQLAQLFVRRAESTPERVAFRAKTGGRWEPTRWRDALRQGNAVATFLVERGVQRQDKVAIIGATRPQWCISDMGGLLAGAVTVGAYPTLTARQLAYVLEHADAKVVFVAGREELERVQSIRQECPKLGTVIVWDGVDGDRDDVVAWSDVLATKVDHEALAERQQAIHPGDCAIIVYTSGTTGPPKGAMLSHRNIMTLMRQGMGFEFADDEESFSFLPMAHVAERILGFYQRANHGTATAFATSIPAVLEEVKEVQPTLFGSVPRIFEKAHARIQASVEGAPPLKRRLFRWAESVGSRAVDHWQRGDPLPLSIRIQHALADKLVFSRVRKAFGGRVRFFVTGAAPIPEGVLHFFWAAGFPIFEAYGMTESTALTHANRPGAIRLGSVGQPLAMVECKLADDGEVLVRGDTVFLGYYKSEEATQEMIDEDGWLHTGDIGKIDDDGYLFIVDRKKHIIITSGGKNLTPANIENEIKAIDPLISQVHAHGDRRPYVTALVTLGPLEALDFALDFDLESRDAVDRLKRAILENPLARPEGLDPLMAKVTARTAIRQRVARAVSKGNRQLAKVEQVKRVYLLDRELSVEREELTPTLKTKRKNIETHFADAFDRLYEDEDFGIVVEKS